MNSEIETYLDQLLTIKQDAPGIAAGLTDQQFNWRAAPEAWSIAQCFEHLNMLARSSVPVFDAAIADGRAQGLRSDGPFAYPLVERLFIAANEPPPRLRVPTTRAFTPAPERAVEAVMREFMAWQDDVRERLLGADGLDLRRVRMRSPVMALFSYSLGTGFAAFLAHERRHVWQARQVRKVLDLRSADLRSTIERRTEKKGSE